MDASSADFLVAYRGIAAPPINQFNYARDLLQIPKIPGNKNSALHLATNSWAALQVFCCSPKMYREKNGLPTLLQFVVGILHFSECKRTSNEFYLMKQICLERSEYKRSFVLEK